jgi:putative heme-binding domain-containing protein
MAATWTLRTSLSLYQYLSTAKRRRIFLYILSAALTVWHIAPLSGQGRNRDPDPHDVAAGSELFNSICAICHGQEGNQVAGVDLGHGTFHFAKTDQDLIHIIRNGIPGSGMPANNMSEASAGAVVSYLHQMAADNADNTITNGNPDQGRVLYQSLGCAKCHRIGDVGSRLGPDLTDIGNLRRSVILEHKLLDPTKDIRPENRFVTVVTESGRTITGKLMNQDTFTVLLMDSSETLLSFGRADLKQVTIEDKSTIMPSYQGKLSNQDVSDLVTYLKQQKGVPIQ